MLEVSTTFNSLNPSFMKDMKYDLDVYTRNTTRFGDSVNGLASKILNCLLEKTRLICALSFII